MNNGESSTNTLFDAGKSATDANRFYSILLDARAVTTSSNMCDIAEKLVLGEKENAKVALEQLWALKKNLVAEKNGTIDLLIKFYQEKIDVLRAKEEHIKKVSRDSRGLIEEKRKRDEEIASVKQQIADCTREIKDLNDGLAKLTIKEQELILIEQQVRKELEANANELVNGLYEIILSQQEKTEADVPSRPLPKPASPIQAVTTETEEMPRNDLAAAVPVSRVITLEEKPPFPRSVVKTTAGRVIGEYFYDSAIDKDRRHYILYSKFFARVLADNLRQLKARFDQPLYYELLQMIQDAYKRTAGNTRLHFEIATNEILNEKSLKQLWLDAKMRSFDEIERFCARLMAKIEALGQNYRSLLKEQMERCTKDS
jgi:hypothetical protein